MTALLPSFYVPGLAWRGQPGVVHLFPSACVSSSLVAYCLCLVLMWGFGVHSSALCRCCIVCIVHLSAWRWRDAEFASLQAHGRRVVRSSRRILKDSTARGVCSGQAFAQCGLQGGVLRTGLCTMRAATRAHGIIAPVGQGNTPARLVRFLK